MNMAPVLPQAGLGTSPTEQLSGFNAGNMQTEQDGKEAITQTWCKQSGWQHDAIDTRNCPCRLIPKQSTTLCRFL